MRYYKALVKLGHVGRGKSRETYLYIYAENIMQAMERAQKTPAVKHNKIPLNIVEITKEEFIEGKKDDPYTKAMDQLNHGVSLWKR